MLIFKLRQKRFFYEQPEAAVKDTQRYMTLTYSISLALIALLSIAVHITLDQIISEQSKIGRLINISGQQRMLSQRSSAFALEYLYTGSEQAKAEAQAGLNTLKANHAELLMAHKQAIASGRRSSLSSDLIRMYFQPPLAVDATLQDYIQAVELALQTPTWDKYRPIKPSELSFLRLARYELLDGLHAIVNQYELESFQHIEHLRQIQRTVLGIIIITLLAEALFIFRPMVNKIGRLTHELHQDASYDPLSGLINRRVFGLLVNQAIAQHRNTAEPFCLLMLDLDHFKQINDQYGHAAGDQVIREVGSLLKRQSVCAARLGGEEFALLLTHMTAAQAEAFANQIRLQVQQLKILSAPHEYIHVTLSGGVTEYQLSDGPLGHVLANADEALYQAKKQGRNRICVKLSAPTHAFD